MDKAYSMLTRMGFQVLGDLASNKWLSVWQFLNSIVLMMAFHRVFVNAWRRATKVSAEDDDTSSNTSDDEKLGIVASGQAWHRREGRRDLKALSWIERESALFKVMLFLEAAAPVTSLHAFFFKHAHSAPFGEKPSVLFNLCSRARSRPRQVLGVLQRLLTPTARWRVVESRFGAFAEWRPSWKRMAQELVLNLMSGVQRRLVDPFETPPYSNLVPFADPSTSIEERRGNSRGFVRRAKRHVGSVQPQVATPSAVCWRAVGHPLLGSFSVSHV